MRERHGIKASKETAQKTTDDANVNPSDPS